MMYDTKEKILSQTKSYTSIYEIFGSTPFNNVLYKSPKKCGQKQVICTTTCSDTIKISPVLMNNTQYLTSEKYHCLNKNESNKTVVPSTSTIFYDLDDIAKRHSFHCLTEISLSNVNILKAMKLPVNTNVFGRKSEAIVQECVAHVKPKLLPRDSIEINAKKGKRRNIPNIILSSEIFLRDEQYENEYKRSNNYDRDITDRQQKFWSYAKYHTEYTNPVTEEKRIKKKDRGKRTEYPCPCQLFSYACPCTDKKSLTELAKNSKSLTVTDQVTSTTKVCLTEKTDVKINKQKKEKHSNINKEDKPTNTMLKFMQKFTGSDKDPRMQITDKQDFPVVTDANNEKEETHKIETTTHKRRRKVVCPHCKEKVDVISTTEEEDNLKNEPSICRNKEILSTAAYAYRASPRSIISETVDGAEICTHEPPCELVPVCQILLGDDNKYYNAKTTKTQSFPKSTPRVIRITKACRHHPPCTVVPSCQKMNVLKNNCEYVPPCLHRPRCVNLPLCVPFSRTLHYDDTLCNIGHDDRNTECPHIPKCKYIPVCQHDSLANNMDHRIEMVSQMQNAYEFTNGYQTPAFLTNPQANGMVKSFSPFHITSPNTCSCRSNKSCQYDSSNTKCNTTHVPKGSISNETIVFIRDVGCQFRSQNYSREDSVIKTKTSSGSFDYVDVKMGNYYTNVHTLRYEDKFTSPLSEGEVSESSFSVTTSMEIDTQCLSRGHKGTLKSQPTGFNPKTAYVTAYSARIPPLPTVNVTGKAKKKYKLDDSARRECCYPFSVKSRRSFLKGKYKNMFTVKRKKKSNTSKHVISDHWKTKDIVFTKTNDNK